MPDPTLMTKIRLFGTLMKNVAARSKKVKMNKIVSEYGSGKRKKFGLFLMDLGVKAWFQFDKSGEMNWGLGYKGLTRDIETEVFTDFDTLMCLKVGKIKIVDDHNRAESLPFTFYDAWKLDKIRFMGEGSTVDVKGFTDLLKDHPEVIDKLVG
jgi:hypothetical protein